MNCIRNFCNPSLCSYELKCCVIKCPKYPNCYKLKYKTVSCLRDVVKSCHVYIIKLQDYYYNLIEENKKSSNK